MKTSKLNRQLLIRASSDGVTLYMTTEAIDRLIAELARIRNLAPDSLDEVHMGMLFSFFDSDGVYATPLVEIDDSIHEAVVTDREKRLRRSRKACELEADVKVAPYELTIMHVDADLIASHAERSAK